MWMTRCCNTCNLFSTAVASVLIKQSSLKDRAVATNAELNKTLDSALLIQGLAPDLKDTVRSQCLSILKGSQKGTSWLDSIPKKKMTAMDRRLLKSNEDMPTILRYISAVHIWHSPLAYLAIKSGDMTGTAVSSACSFAYWVLAYVNMMCQQNAENGKDIRNNIQSEERVRV